MITKKVPKRIKKDQYLKNLSSLDFFGLGNFAKAINTNIGVITPTMYKGDKNGEIFFKK